MSISALRFILSMFVLAQAALTKYHRVGGFTEMSYIPILEAESPRSGYQYSQVLVKAFCLADNCLLAMPSDGGDTVSFGLTSSYKAPIPSWGLPSSMTSSKSPPKGPPDTIILWVRSSTYVFGVGGTQTLSP